MQLRRELLCKEFISVKNISMLHVILLGRSVQTNGFSVVNSDKNLIIFCAPEKSVKNVIIIIIVTKLLSNILIDKNSCFHFAE